MTGRCAAPLPIEALARSAGFRGDARFALLDADDPAGLLDVVPPLDAPEPVDPYARAWDEGHAAGLAEARLEASRRLAAEIEARQAIRLGVTRIDHALEMRLRERLRDTVVALCEATLAPLALDAQALARRVERAAAMLARAEDERVVRLHPEDAAIVAGRIGDALTIRADPSLARGAVRVEGANGGVEDGPEQWRAAITAEIDRC